MYKKIKKLIDKLINEFGSLLKFSKNFFNIGLKREWVHSENPLHKKELKSDEYWLRHHKYF
jgi:hypothetical protein